MDVRPFLLAGIVVLLPGADAASITIEITSEHGPDHVMDVPRETRRTEMTFHVRAKSEGFACPQGATLTMPIVVPAMPEWAGGSFEPAQAKIAYSAMGPGLDAIGTMAPDVTFGLFWGDNAPAKDAAVTYPVQTAGSRLDGVCLPSPAIREGETTMKAAMKDVLETPVGSDASECAVSGMCAEAGPAPAPAAVPTLTPLAVLVAFMAAVALRRNGR